MLARLTGYQAQRSDLWMFGRAEVELARRSSSRGSRLEHLGRGLLFLRAAAEVDRSETDRRQALVVLRRLLHRLTGLILFARGALDDDAREDFYRAGGDCICSTCAEPYRLHAVDPFDRWLNVLCNGQRVKL